MSPWDCASVIERNSMRETTNLNLRRGRFASRKPSVKSVEISKVSLRQEKLRRGGKDVTNTDSKPLAATLRVTNPARQGLANHRKRVLRPYQQWPGRSVDSQH